MVNTKMVELRFMRLIKCKCEMWQFIVEIMTTCGGHAAGESSNTPEEAFYFIAVIDYVIPNNAPKSWI